LLAGGDLWWDGSQFPVAEFPSGLGNHVLYSGAIWLSAYDEFDSLYLAGQTYRNQGADFWTGPVLDGNMPAYHCAAWDRHFIIYATDVNTHLDNIDNASSFPIDANAIPLAVKEWPAKGNQYLANSNLTVDEPMAPFIDANNNGIYEPEEGDYPKIKGDQCIFWVMNDKGNIHGRTGGTPLEVEIQCMAYAYATNDVLNDCTFYDYKIINKSNRDYHDFIFSQFVDPDLGEATDDFIGCDTARNMAFAYNASSPDGDYGFDIPVVGVVMLQTPEDKQIGSFMYFSNNGSGTVTDPDTFSEFRNYQESKWKDGIPLTDGGTGYGGAFPAKYAYPGNPTDATGWSECNVSGIGNGGDRRFVMSSSTYNMAAGECLSFTIAAVPQVVQNYQPCVTDIDSVLGQKVDEVKILMGYDLVDANCTVDENPVVVSPAIRDLADSDLIQLMPNPSNGLVQINGVEIAKAVLYDLTGKKLLTTNKNQLNVSALSEGIYFLQVIDKNGLAYKAKKLIVAK
ncbi:MAG: T9SS type A sorting domain-containing protein, partial [Chitinophagales bacterium]